MSATDPASWDQVDGELATAGQAMAARGWAMHVTDQLDLPSGLVAWTATLTRHATPVACVEDRGDGGAPWVRWGLGPGISAVAAHDRGLHRAAWERDLAAAGVDEATALGGLDVLDVATTGVPGVGVTADPVNPTTAVFLYEGFRDWVAGHEHLVDLIAREQPGVRLVAAEQLALVEGQIGGAIEQAHLMAHYAPAVDAALAGELATDPAGWDRPGVAEYEVINPVGHWIADHIAQGHGQPPMQSVVEATRTLTRGFLDRTTPTTGAGAPVDLRAHPRTATPTPGAPVAATTPSRGRGLGQ